MEPAEQHQVVERRRAAVCPVDHVMRMEPPAPSTAGVDATAITDPQRPADGGVRPADALSEVENLTLRPMCGEHDARVARNWRATCGMMPGPSCMRQLSRPRLVGTSGSASELVRMSASTCTTTSTVDPVGPAVGRCSRAASGHGHEGVDERHRWRRRSLPALAQPTHRPLGAGGLADSTSASGVGSSDPSGWSNSPAESSGGWDDAAHRVHRGWRRAQPSRRHRLRGLAER
jgi:hypothetical protein